MSDLVPTAFGEAWARHRPDDFELKHGFAAALTRFAEEYYTTNAADRITQQEAVIAGLVEAVQCASEELAMMEYEPSHPTQAKIIVALAKAKESRNVTTA